MNRRTFLGAAAAAVAAGATRLPIRKAVWYGMLPGALSHTARLRMARDTGFEEVECNTTEDPGEAEEIKKAAEAAGIRIHSVMNQAHWEYPLSSADPAVVARSMKGMETSLRNAQLWGADTVLLVPAVVNAQTSYKDAWVRSQRQIRKLLPMAGKLKVVIAVENVWNKFLLSPLEFARYVDEFDSPWVRAYFDVGNILFYGYPQDWIRTLGKRIVKLHFKDFRQREITHWQEYRVEFVNLREGDVDWKEVHHALAEIGYSGSATVELAAGDADYLRDVSRRVDLILSGS
jgi:L-ribulose-5-phosphate 3-epimerase